MFGVKRRSQGLVDIAIAFAVDSRSFYKKNSELRSKAGDVSVSSGQNERMNSVRLGNEYWFKTVQLLETLPRSKIPVGVRPATR
ncbi:hypothetical protein [Nostoc sp.]|uniref:hypothetical protein n=1 Tax=Nostoc sp. TaxID=1180 RepID=UPI002FF4740B